MRGDDHVRALQREGRALAEAAADNLGAPVPSCPGWDVAELVWHTGEVHRFWDAIVARRLQEPSSARDIERPPPGDLVAWYRDGLDHLVDTLAAADPGTSVWTWAGPQDAAWVRRRMAQETAVHRWDAQAAAGAPEPIEPALATDGVDEFLAYFLPSDPQRLLSGSETVHLHATDGGGEWTVAVADGEVRVDRSHAKGDSAARGSASDLLLLLWRRIGPESLETFGDEEALARFLGRADLT